MLQILLEGTEAENYIRSIVRQEISTSQRVEFVDTDVQVSLQEASELLGVCLTTIHQYKRSGQLPFRKVGGRVCLKKVDVLALRDGKEVSREA